MTYFPEPIVSAYVRSFVCVCVCRTCILMRTYYGHISCVHVHAVRSCVYRAFVRMYMIYIVCRYTCMSSFRACVCPALFVCRAFMHMS